MQLNEYPFNDILALSTLTLTTASREGFAHAAPVYFEALQPPVVVRPAGDIAPFHLYFFSEPDSRHCRDIASSGWLAGAIYLDTQDWREIRGLQVRGKVRLMSEEPEWEAVFQAYQQKFPFVRAIQEEVAQNELYGFTPTWIRLVDNRPGFGFKQEWSYPDDNA